MEIEVLTAVNGRNTMETEVYCRVCAEKNLKVVMDKINETLAMAYFKCPYCGSKREVRT